MLVVVASVIVTGVGVAVAVAVGVAVALRLGLVQPESVTMSAISTILMMNSLENLESIIDLAYIDIALAK
jgi:hypothetical protein